MSSAPVSTLAVVSLSVLLTLGQHTGPATLREVDWPTVLASDPALAVDSEIPPPPFGPAGPYVRQVNPPAPDQPAVEGFALLDNVLYGDLDGDGVEEGVILLSSGGTAGVVGLLVYHADEPRPRLAAVLGGYKLGARIENSGLVVLQPRYAGFEANCCPSAEVKTHYSLAGDQLIATSEQEQPFEEAQAETVQQFYAELDRHALAEAYELVSEDFKQAQPFDVWSSGYQNTEHVRVDDLAQTPEGVNITFTSFDSQPDGQQTMRQFKGTWSLVWGDAVHHWLLDSANIVEVT